MDLYFKLTEKITVYDGKLVVSLLDGFEVECALVFNPYIFEFLKMGMGNRCSPALFL
ncbi:MAG: hypothetical protein Q8911_11010 [Bacillota bacterium]|nr:hypothetical protein [Bacillota bacterium]